LAAVWNGRIVSESTLSTRINAARSAIGDLLAGSGIRGRRVIRVAAGLWSPISAGIVGGESRCRWHGTLLPFTPIGQSVLGHIDRRWLPHLVQANGFRACRMASTIGEPPVDGPGHCATHVTFSVDLVKRQV
jgi:hypothetical protein